jgi:hypothetical protein
MCSDIPQNIEEKTGIDVVLSRLDELEETIKKLLEDKNNPKEDISQNEIVITKGQINKAENVIEKWFEQFEGDIIAQLDFIDKTTFGYLDSIPKKCGIKIITSNIKDRELCKRRAKRCSKDRPHFSIIEITKIHQRWIGSVTSFIVEIGTDLKLDALGRSTHTIRRMNPDAYEVTLNHFAKLWETNQKGLREIYGDDLEKSLFYQS